MQFLHAFVMWLKAVLAAGVVRWRRERQPRLPQI
jgi:hypothetical protein